MIKIPAYLSRQYSSFIIHQGVAPQKQQAGHAITLYFKLIIQDIAKCTNSPLQEQVFLKNKISPTRNIEICQENKLLEEPIAQQHGHETAKKDVLRSNGTGWTRKLQTYTKSKDSRLLSVEDVKSFLTWLAVEQNDVSRYVQ